MSTKYFTFGPGHMTSAALPKGGRLTDYWVAVDAPDKHREHFIEHFTTPYCPRRMQFAMEYDASNFKPEYCPCGELVRITVD